jgi:prolyl 4-hydroxylase
MEIPQVCRYTTSQTYKYHFDGKEDGTLDAKQFFQNGGQRLITVLIYLNTVDRGGHTHFKHMDLSIPPEQGSALVFFPAYSDGKLDTRMLHCAKPAIDTKWVSQIWIRQNKCKDGMSSRRMHHDRLSQNLLQFAK